MSLDERLAEYRNQLDGDFVSAVEAGRFIDMMRAEHADELDEWMTARALRFVTSALSKADRDERHSVMARVSRPARFADAAREFSETGDAGSFVPLFKVRFVIDESDVRRPLGAMTGADCQFAMTTYDRQGNRLLAVGAFFGALAKKAKSKRVSDVMDEATCERLLRSFLHGTDVSLSELADAA